MPSLVECLPISILDDVEEMLAMIAQLAGITVDELEQEDELELEDELEPIIYMLVRGNQLLRRLARSIELIEL